MFGDDTKEQLKNTDEEKKNDWFTLPHHF
jgi:hypothetical protein